MTKRNIFLSSHFNMKNGRADEGERCFDRNRIPGKRKYLFKWSVKLSKGFFTRWIYFLFIAPGFAKGMSMKCDDHRKDKYHWDSIVSIELRCSRGEIFWKMKTACWGNWGVERMKTDKRKIGNKLLNCFYNELNLCFSRTCFYKLGTKFISLASFDFIDKSIVIGFWNIA